MSYGEEDKSRLKDIDEELRQKLIIDLLEKSDSYLITQQYEGAYRTLKSIFYKIQMFTFKYKDDIIELTKVIDAYIDSSGGSFVDEGDVIMFNENQVKIKELVEQYSQLIPFALNDLGLYFRVMTKKDDDDEFFNEKTFTIKKSFIQDKIDELVKNITMEELLKKHLTSRQINDAYSRFKVEVSKKYGRRQD